METRAHTQGIWLRSRDQLKESALSFENKRRDAYSRTKELARIYYRKWKALAEQNKKKNARRTTQGAKGEDCKGLLTKIRRQKKERRILLRRKSACVYYAKWKAWETNEGPWTESR